MSASQDHEREPLPPSAIERSQGLIVRALVLVCVLLVVVDVVFQFVGHRHTHFAIEEWPGFYALMGFCSYVFLVITAKQLRKLVMRPLDYYGEEVPAPPRGLHSSPGTEVTPSVFTRSESARDPSPRSLAPLAPPSSGTGPTRGAHDQDAADENADEERES